MATTSYGSPYVSGSDLVAGWPAASLTVANAIDAAGYYIGRGINAQTASYVGVLTDAGKTVTMTVATSNTFTVPLNATVAYPTGTQINILNLGAGACTVTATGGVTISGTISALATNDSASVIKTGTNTWSYLAAPAPGLSLVTPTSVAGAGVTVSGGAVSIAAATTASINGVFSALYDNYLAIFSGVASVDGDIQARLRVAGTDNTAANYSYQVAYFNNTTNNSARATGQTSFARAGGGMTDVCLMSLTMVRPFVAAPTGVASQNVYTTTGGVFYNIAGLHTASTSFDGLTIFPAAGNLTGTLRIYGLRNS